LPQTFSPIFLAFALACWSSLPALAAMLWIFLTSLAFAAATSSSIFGSCCSSRS